MEKFFENLSSESKEIFKRIFEIEEREIEINDNLIKEKYPDFQRQKLVYIKNKILSKEIILNLTRKKRKQPNKAKLELETYDPFCDYQNSTPIDELGRLENALAVSSKNLSQMADYHSLIIFKKHNFEDLKFDDFFSAFMLAKEWFMKIKDVDQEIMTQILIWNYHFRSGASILHPHFQVLSYLHFPLNLEFLAKRVEEYKKKFNSDYFEDYFYLSRELKIGKEKENLKIFVDLTPKKEKGLIINGELNEKNLDFLWDILMKLKNLGTESFNFFYIYDSPKIKNLGFFVDRGEINKINSDIGALEIFDLPVISTDPIEFSKEIFSN